MRRGHRENSFTAQLAGHPPTALATPVGPGRAPPMPLCQLWCPAKPSRRTKCHSKASGHFVVAVGKLQN